jgi:hypothetical protein
LDRAQLIELHYITPTENLDSIMSRGILSHISAQKYGPVSVALQEIQAIRRKVRIPGGLRLHEYANLYFTARNPMMYRLQAIHRDLVVLKVSTDVLDLADVVLTDGNASSEYTVFLPYPTGLCELDHDLIFARYWTDDDPIEYYRKKRAKCAEVLVPHRVDPGHILGAYASNGDTLANIERSLAGLNNELYADLFFQN